MDELSSFLNIATGGSEQAFFASVRTSFSLKTGQKITISNEGNEVGIFLKENFGG